MTSAPNTNAALVLRVSREGLANTTVSTALTANKPPEVSMLEFPRGLKGASPKAYSKRQPITFEQLNANDKGLWLTAAARVGHSVTGARESTSIL